MNNSSEIIPRILESPLLEEYPVSYEALVKKMDQVVEFTAHYEDESGEQLIPVSFIPGRPGSKETIIINTPWSDSAHRDFNELRHAALAEHIGADVIIVGFPGHDEDLKGGITPLQRIELTKDDSPSFSRVGMALASAVDQVSTIDELGENYWNDRKVTVAGYSQGASSQIGMLEHLSPAVAKSVTDLFIWESPDMLEPTKKIDLGKRFMKDGNKAGKYYEENEIVFGEENAKKLGITDPGVIGIVGLAKRMLITQPRQLLTGTPDAIARSTLSGDLKAAYDTGVLHGVNIHVINGGDSLVSPPEQGEKLVSMLIQQASEAGDINHVIKKGSSHPAQESFADNSSTVKKIKK